MKIKVFHIRLVKQYLQQDQDNMNTFIKKVKVKKTSAELVTAKINYWSILVFYDELQDELTNKPTEKFYYPADATLTPEEQRIYASLKQWRNDKANQFGLPAYMICSNTELLTVAKVRPQTTKELMSIKGFADLKTSKYGDDIIGILDAFE